MIVVAISLLAFIIGLLVGFYGRAVYIRLDMLYREWQYRQEAQQAGVVQPSKTPIQPDQPIDLSSESGPVMRPSPDRVAFEAWQRDHPKQ